MIQLDRLNGRAMECGGGGPPHSKPYSTVTLFARFLG